LEDFKIMESGILDIKKAFFRERGFRPIPEEGFF